MDAEHLRAVADYLAQQNPYPESVFTMQLDEVASVIPDDHARTRVAGCLSRFGWGRAVAELRDLATELDHPDGPNLAEFLEMNMEDT